MAADETCVVDGLGDGTLHTAHVGDQPVRLGEHPGHLVDEGEHRRRDERDLGVGIEPARGDDAHPLGLLEAVRAVVVTGDVPAALGEGARDRAADEPEARHVRPTRC